MTDTCPPVWTDWARHTWASSSPPRSATFAGRASRPPTSGCVCFRNATCWAASTLGWTTPPNTTGSTQISFPLSGLDLSPWLHTRESHTFCLIEVICHHGVSGNGGHYTCYCYNPVSDSWYHFPLWWQQREAGGRSHGGQHWLGLCLILFYRRNANSDLHWSSDRLKKVDDEVMW